MNHLELIVFKVDHGLSVAIIERPENYVTLVDLGASSGFTPLKFLNLKYRVRPDVVYITHPHADHLTDVETALDPTFKPDALFYQTYDWQDVKRRERRDLSYKVGEFQTLISYLPKKRYGGGAKLEPWYYTPDRAKRLFGEAGYVNNSSLFLVYRWRGFKISIAGDLESAAIDAMVRSPKFQRSAANSDILIPSHHGHRNGFASEWVSRIGLPQINIISVQQRDPHVDPRYRTPECASGVQFGGRPRYSLTTRTDGTICANMWYENAKPMWEFTCL